MSLALIFVSQNFPLSFFNILYSFFGDVNQSILLKKTAWNLGLIIVDCIVKNKLYNLFNFKLIWRL